MKRENDTPRLIGALCIYVSMPTNTQPDQTVSSQPVCGVDRNQNLVE